MTGQPSLEHLPFYREYLDQILKPRVAKAIEDVRANLANHAWNELLVRLAEDPQSGAADAAAIQKMRQILEHTLGLRIGVLLDAEFGGPQAAPPQAPQATPEARRVEEPRTEVVDRTFPDNPLARAVGAMRRPGR